MTTRRGLACALLIALAAGCASGSSGSGDRSEAGAIDTPGCASPIPGERVVVPDATMWNNTPDVEQMISRIVAEGGGRFAASYAGLRVDAEHGITSVYRVPNAEFDTFLREVAGSQCFRIHTAKYSHSALQVWRDRVSADMPSLQDLPLTMLAIKEDGSGVLIGTTDVAATEAAFRQRYGADAPLVFEKREPVSLM